MSSNSGMGALALWGAFALLIIAYVPLYYNSEREVTNVLITDKERVMSKDSSKYIVFTDKGEFEVTDSLLYGDWRSSSRYNDLRRDYRCNVTVAGWRWGFMSMYPNIIRVGQCAKDD